MYILAFLPFFLQALCIGIDEGVFHRKRGLPKWERIGHPLDTFSMIVCLLFAYFIPYSPLALKIYIGLAAFSTLLVTKDEFVHKEHCPSAENWLHAVLFTLHPITLFSVGMMWRVVQGASAPLWIVQFFQGAPSLTLFLKAQIVLISLFCLYQILFWNFIWKEKPVVKY